MCEKLQMFGPKAQAIKKTHICQEKFSINKPIYMKAKKKQQQQQKWVLAITKCKSAQKQSFLMRQESSSVMPCLIVMICFP